MRPTAPSDTSINAAPIAAPDSVTAETGREAVAERGVDGVVAGVEGGPPSASIEGVGVATTAPPPPAPAAPVRAGSGIRAPAKISDAAPIYPLIARSAHVQGVVILEAVLDTAGRVDDVRVLRSIPLLDQAAIERGSASGATRPRSYNGRAVPV